MVQFAGTSVQHEIPEQLSQRSHALTATSMDVPMEALDGGPQCLQAQRLHLHGGRCETGPDAKIMADSGSASGLGLRGQSNDVSAPDLSPLRQSHGSVRSVPPMRKEAEMGSSTRDLLDFRGSEGFLDGRCHYHVRPQ